MKPSHLKGLYVCIYMRDRCDHICIYTHNRDDVNSQFRCDVFHFRLYNTHYICKSNKPCFVRDSMYICIYILNIYIHIYNIYIVPSVIFCQRLYVYMYIYVTLCIYILSLVSIKLHTPCLFRCVVLRLRLYVHVCIYMYLYCP